MCARRVLTSVGPGGCFPQTPAGKLKEAQEKVDMTRGVLDKKSDELEDMQRAVASMQAQHKVQLSSQQVPRQHAYVFVPRRESAFLFNRRRLC